MCSSGCLANTPLILTVSNLRNIDINLARSGEMTVHTATSTNSIINQKSISATVLGNLVVSTFSLFTSTRSSD